MNSKTLFLGSILLLCLATCSLGAWQSSPPLGSQTVSCAGNASGQRLFVCTRWSGAWQSGDAGSSWAPLPLTFPPNDESWNSPRWTILDAAGDTAIACCSGHHSSYTFDGGQTWQEFSSECARDGFFFDIYHQAHNIWLTAGFDGFCRSEDYGQTWASSGYLPDAMGMNGFCQDPHHDSTLYAWAGSLLRDGRRDRAYRSTDLGATWQQVLNLDSVINPQVGLISDMLVSASGEIMVVGEADGVLRSSDQGASWYSGSYFNELNTPPMKRRMIEDVSQPGTFFVTGQCPGGLWRSTDNGFTWSPCPGLYPDTVLTGWNLCQNAYSGDLWLVIDGLGTFRSEDHAESWQAVAAPPASPSGTLAALDNAITLSRDNDALYWQYRAESGWSAVHNVPSNEAVRRSITRFCFSHGDTLSAILHVDHVFYPQNWGDQMAYTVDNGASWIMGTDVPQDSLSMYTTYDVYQSATVTRIAGITAEPYEDYLVTSEDEGQTWLRSDGPGGGLEYSGIVQSDSAIYVAGRIWQGDSLANDIFRTRDRGLNWERLNMPSVPIDSSVYLFGMKDELLATDGNLLLHWSQGTWNERGVVPALPLVIVPSQPPKLVALQSGGGLWISEDMGSHWFARPYATPYDNLPLTLSSLVCDAARNRLWASTEIGPCYLDFSELAAGSRPLDLKPADYSVLTAYPNPFNSVTTIRFNLLKRQRVKLDLYDIQGRLVRTLCDELKEAGRQELRFEGKDLASGVYFVRLKSPEQTKTQKILLLK